VEISLSLPCYNEEGNVRPVVTKAINVLDKIAQKYEIIIVDDGSSDKTLSIAREMAALDPNIKVIHHEVNQGYGAAVRSGLKNSCYEYVAFADGDGQLELEDLKALTDLMPANDMVIGYRSTRKDPFYRWLNSRMYGFLIRFLFGLKVRDLNCALKVFRKQVIDDIEIESKAALVNAEILIKARKKGYTRIKEVPVKHYPRTVGKQTGANLMVIIRTFREIFRLWQNLK
jgi:glycosyltransferase involved in cell wall biosynthesis